MAWFSKGHVFCVCGCGCVQVGHGAPAAWALKLPVWALLHVHPSLIVQKPPSGGRVRSYEVRILAVLFLVGRLCTPVRPADLSLCLQGEGVGEAQTGGCVATVG